jgi:hypothetical protein
VVVIGTVVSVRGDVVAGTDGRDEEVEAASEHAVTSTMVATAVASRLIERTLEPSVTATHGEGRK